MTIRNPLLVLAMVGAGLWLAITATTSATAASPAVGAWDLQASGPAASAAAESMVVAQRESQRSRNESGGARQGTTTGMGRPDRPVNRRGGRGGEPTPPTFSEFDRDGDGRITRSEFQERHRVHRVEREAEGKGRRPEHDPDEMFQRIDADGNGAIDRQELRRHKRASAGPSRRSMEGEGQGPRQGGDSSPRTPARQPPAFGELDRDGDGQVTREELMAHHRTRTQEQPGLGRREHDPNEMFEAMDVDGSGAVSAEELDAFQQGRGRSAPRGEGQSDDGQGNDGAGDKSSGT